MEVVAVAGEGWIFFAVEHDIKIACGTAKRTCFAFILIANARAILDSCMNLDLHRLLTNHPSFAAASLTRVGDDLTCAATRAASARDTEEALLIAKLSATSAGVARCRLLTLRAASPVTRIACFRFAHGNFGGLAEDRIFQFDGDVGAQIGSALRAAATTSAAEGIAKSEDVAENFAEILESRGIEAAESSTAHPGVAKAVVLRTLILVRKDAIRLAGFFEFFFGSLVARIAVGVILHGEFAVCALEFLISAASSYT